MRAPLHAHADGSGRAGAPPCPSSSPARPASSVRVSSTPCSRTRRRSAGSSASSRPTCSGRAVVRPAGGSPRRQRSPIPRSRSRSSTPRSQVVFHLAAVLSGEAESNFDLGMLVNVDGTRLLLGACRHRAARHAVRLRQHDRRVRRAAAGGGAGASGAARRPRRTAPRRPSPSCSCSSTARRGFIDARRLPRADGGGATGPAQLGALVVRQRHRPRAAGRPGEHVPRAARHAIVGELARGDRRQPAARRDRADGGVRRPRGRQPPGADGHAGGAARQPRARRRSARLGPASGSSRTSASAASSARGLAPST